MPTAIREPRLDGGRGRWTLNTPGPTQSVDPHDEQRVGQRRDVGKGGPRNKAGGVERWTRRPTTHARSTTHAPPNDKGPGTDNAVPSPWAFSVECFRCDYVVAFLRPPPRFSFAAARPRGRTTS